MASTASPAEFGDSPLGYLHPLGVVAALTCVARSPVIWASESLVQHPGRRTQFTSYLPLTLRSRRFIATQTLGIAMERVLISRAVGVTLQHFFHRQTPALLAAILPSMAHHYRQLSCSL